MPLENPIREEQLAHIEGPPRIYEDKESGLKIVTGTFGKDYTLFDQEDLSITYKLQKGDRFCFINCDANMGGNRESNGRYIEGEILHYDRTKWGIEEDTFYRAYVQRMQTNLQTAKRAVVKIAPTHVFLDTGPLALEEFPSLIEGDYWPEYDIEDRKSLALPNAFFHMFNTEATPGVVIDVNEAGIPPFSEPDFIGALKILGNPHLLELTERIASENLSGEGREKAVHEMKRVLRKQLNQYIQAHYAESVVRIDPLQGKVREYPHISMHRQHDSYQMRRFTAKEGVSQHDLEELNNSKNLSLSDLLNRNTGDRKFLLTLRLLNLLEQTDIRILLTDVPGNREEVMREYYAAEKAVLDKYPDAFKEEIQGTQGSATGEKASLYNKEAPSENRVVWEIEPKGLSTEGIYVTSTAHKVDYKCEWEIEESREQQIFLPDRLPTNIPQLKLRRNIHIPTEGKEGKFRVPIKEGTTIAALKVTNAGEVIPCKTYIIQDGCIEVELPPQEKYILVQIEASLVTAQEPLIIPNKFTPAMSVEFFPDFAKDMVKKSQASADKLQALTDLIKKRYKYSVAPSPRQKYYNFLRTHLGEVMNREGIDCNIATFIGTNLAATADCHVSAGFGYQNTGETCLTTLKRHAVMIDAHGKVYDATPSNLSNDSATKSYIEQLKIRMVSNIDDLYPSSPTGSQKLSRYIPVHSPHEREEAIELPNLLTGDYTLEELKAAYAVLTHLSWSNPSQDQTVFPVPQELSEHKLRSKLSTTLNLPRLRDDSLWKFPIDLSGDMKVKVEAILDELLAKTRTDE